MSAGPTASASVGKDILEAIGDVQAAAKQASSELKDIKREATSAERELNQLERGIQRAQARKDALAAKGRPTDGATVKVGGREMSLDEAMKQRDLAMQRAQSAAQAKDDAERRKEALDDKKRAEAVQRAADIKSSKDAAVQRMADIKSSKDTAELRKTIGSLQTGMTATMGLSSVNAMVSGKLMQAASKMPAFVQAKAVVSGLASKVAPFLGVAGIGIAGGTVLKAIADAYGKGQIEQARQREKDIDSEFRFLRQFRGKSMSARDFNRMRDRFASARTQGDEFVSRNASLAASITEGLLGGDFTGRGAEQVRRVEDEQRLLRFASMYGKASASKFSLGSFMFEQQDRLDRRLDQELRKTGMGWLGNIAVRSKLFINDTAQAILGTSIYGETTEAAQRRIAQDEIKKGMDAIEQARRSEMEVFMLNPANRARQQYANTLLQNMAEFQLSAAQQWNPY